MRSLIAAQRGGKGEDGSWSGNHGLTRGVLHPSANLNVESIIQQNRWKMGWEKPPETTVQIPLHPDHFSCIC